MIFDIWKPVFSYLFDVTVLICSMMEAEMKKI